MAALDYLLRAGLTAELNGDKLRLRPADRITNADRLYVRDHRVELIAELNAANDPTLCWLHLLVLAGGYVVQACGDIDTSITKQKAHQQHGDNLLAVVAVPGFERPLSEAEIVKALTGTLATSSPTPAPSSLWLPRVARLLGTRPTVLLEGGHLEPHDFTELIGTDAALVADAIRTSLAWVNRLQRVDQSAEVHAPEKFRSQHTVLTAATASKAWRQADAAYTNHLMSCSACHAATSRYCVAGVDLRQRYNSTPMEESE
ncbi:hypothetical protein [Pseudomonas mandelii]|uniref:Cytochrome c domain-containing protein n=1 Tax=Pseudomonas mandelii TaxID=75612 RepID=A0AB36D1D3_9PSED|nr:hypothetical protein [Pseudomonas mandelii]NMZ80796.1 hypothetical protein [Pseudomonas mandelii]